MKIRSCTRACLSLLLWRCLECFALKQCTATCIFELFGIVFRRIELLFHVWVLLCALSKWTHWGAAVKMLMALVCFEHLCRFDAIRVNRIELGVIGYVRATRYLLVTRLCPSPPPLVKR